MCVDDTYIKKLALDAAEYQKMGLKLPGSAGRHSTFVFFVPIKNTNFCMNTHTIVFIKSILSCDICYLVARYDQETDEASVVLSLQSAQHRKKRRPKEKCQRTKEKS